MTSETFTVFLDRDGVFNRLILPGVTRPEALEWLPGAKEAFARLNRPDIQTCLCTNQPTVGHLMSTPAMIRRTNGHLKAELEAAGGRLDNMEAAYSPVWFPHRRRKPRPGMLIDGAKKLPQPVNPQRAVMIGDTLKDAKAAAAFGCEAILLATTHADISDKAKAANIEAKIMPSLREAVDYILSQLN